MIEKVRLENILFLDILANMNINYVSTEVIVVVRAGNGGICPMARFES